MKLNNDCIRAVMLELEETLNLSVNSNGEIESHSLWLESLFDALPNYSKEDIFYSLDNLKQAGYVELTTQWADGEVLCLCAITKITFEGHEFLNRIRDSKRWAVVKGGLSAIRDYSLSAITAVAEGVANAAISKYLEQL